MALWNQKCLPAPPTNTYVSKTTNLDLLKLRHALQDCISHFKNEDFLIRETAILSRALYRMKMKFRSSKEFKSLEKINHALQNYLTSNICRDLKNIMDLIPLKYHTVTYLPTRNMLSFILVRIQGLVKLMERVYNTCQVAACEINMRLFLGHCWRNFIILFALVSRLYILVKFNTKHLCELYGKLLPHSNKLENPGKNWLPEGYNLPGDLREWLGVKWAYEEEFIDLTKDLELLNPTVKIVDFFNLIDDDDDDDDDVEFCDEYVLVDEEDRNIAKDFRKLKPIEETFTRNRMRGFSINEDDIGEDIAEIIKLNQTTMAMENNKKIQSHSSDHNLAIINENVGEDISSIVNKDDQLLQVFNLHETSEYVSNIEKKKDKKSTVKTKKRTKQNRIIKNEIIVIPETPVKTNKDNIIDGSIIVLGDTSVCSKDLPEELSKSSKKKKKSSNKKKALSSKNDKSLDYTIDKKKSISLDGANISLPISDSNCPMSQSPSRKKAIKTKENIIQQSNTKRKLSENNNNNENVNSAKKKKVENESTTNKCKENEIIVIPETPVKTNKDKVIDAFVVVSGDTSVSSKDLLEKVSKKNKRRKKSENKSNKKKPSSCSIDNTVDKNTSISSDGANFSFLPINDSNCLTSQSPSRQKAVKTKNKIEESNFKRRNLRQNYNINENMNFVKIKEEEDESTISNITKSLNVFKGLTPQRYLGKTKINSEDMFEQLNSNIKIEENCPVKMEIITKEELMTQSDDQREISLEKLEPKKELMTQLDDQRGISLEEREVLPEKEMRTEVMVPQEIGKHSNLFKALAKKERRKMRKKEMASKRGKVNTKEYEKFNSLCGQITNFIKGKSKEIKEEESGEDEKSKNKKSKDEKGTSLSSTETNKDIFIKLRKESVVRLTLMNRISKDNKVPETDSAICSESKGKNPKKINLVPRLDTALKATLNIDSLIKASTVEEAFEQNIDCVALRTLEKEDIGLIKNSVSVGTPKQKIKKMPLQNSERRKNKRKRRKERLLKMKKSSK